jgi:hypothetical protein
MGSIRCGKCKGCGELFRADYRNRGRQRYCSAAECRRRSKAESQRRWCEKAENRDYFRGPDATDRVRRWRQQHPGYWRRGGRERDGDLDPLQDVCDGQVSVSTNESAKPENSPLQELSDTQPLVLLGLIAKLTGSTLQDDIVAASRNLVSLGRDIIGGKERRYDSKAGLGP